MLTDLISGKAEYNAGPFPGPVNHQMEVTVVQVKHRAYFLINHSSSIITGFITVSVCSLIPSFVTEVPHLPLYNTKLLLLVNMTPKSIAHR